MRKFGCYLLFFKKSRKIKKILSLLVFLIIFSCDSQELTKTEVNAVQKVLNFYNGECHRYKGFETKNGTKKKYFELEMSKSELLNKNLHRLLSHTGNIAYLFYSNLGNEKSNYNEIRVNIKLENGTNEDFQFPYSKLLEIDKLQPKLKEINNSLASQDYKKLATYFNPKFGVKEDNIKSLFSNLQNKFGVIKKTQIQGFQFDEAEKYGKVIVIPEALVLEKVSATMLYIFDRKSQQLLTIEFP